VTTIKKVVAAALVAAAVPAVVAAQGRGARISSTDLSRAASEMNKFLPMWVDSSTELLNVLGIDSTLIYNYRLTIDAADVSAADIETVRKPGIVNGACSDPDLRNNLLDRGITLQFSYSDRNRIFIGKMDVTVRDCVKARVGHTPLDSIPHLGSDSKPKRNSQPGTSSAVGTATRVAL
jgi:hypothetical protein